jgi:L-aspartate oxidase
MSRSVAVVRDAAGLRSATFDILAIAAFLDGKPLDRRDLWELRNMTQSAAAVVAAAEHRRESRGAHHRRDYPDLDPALAGRHSLLAPSVWDGEWRFGGLEDVLPDGARDIRSIGVD